MQQRTDISKAVFRDGKWHLTLKPSISALFKRVFDGVEKVGTNLTISDSPKNARDLLWFSERHAFEFVPMMRIIGQAALQDEREESVRRILSGEYVPSDPKLALPLRDYQMRAVDLAVANGGLLLGDDLGIGKTAMSIGVLARKEALPAVVVTLTSLPWQWQREIAKFAPELRTHVVKNTKVYPLDRNKAGKPIPLPDVLIMSYSKLVNSKDKSWAEWIAEHGYNKTVIYDEGQELRNSTSMKYKAAKLLREDAAYCVIATGTPVYNYGGEIYNVVSIAQPGSLGSEKEFKQEWCGGGGGGPATEDQNGASNMRKVRVEDPVALGAHLREIGVYLRRTKKDVGRELPKLSRIFHTVDTDSSHFTDIGSQLEQLCRMVMRSGGPGLDKMKAAGELDWKLRRATGLAKAIHVAHFVRLLIASGESVILYGWHREVYNQWRDLFTSEELGNLKPAFYTGTENPLQKDEARRKFVSGETKLIILSLRAGAGLDGLQHVCSTVVFGELDWAPGVHEQCLSADTEILTDAGFRGVDAVHEGDTVAGFDRSAGTIRWVSALAKTDRKLGEGEAMFACRTEKVDFRVTGEHRMVVRRKRRTTRGSERSSWEIALAQDLVGAARRFVPVSGVQETPGVPLDDCELRLLGWFVTDGHFNGRELYFYQEASQPWNEDLIEVLNKCGLKWSKYQRRNRSGSLMNVYVVTRGTQPRWSLDEVTLMKEMRAAGHSCGSVAKWLKRSASAILKKEKKLANGPLLVPVVERAGRGWDALGPYLEKDLSGLLEPMTREQLRSFLRGVHMGDGAKCAKNVYRITSTNKVFFDRLQSICVRRGFSANLSTRKTPTKAGKTVYDLWIADMSEASLARPSKPGGFAKTTGQPGERVWCVTNELGTIVTRRNGKVSILGNCEGRAFRDGQLSPVQAYYLVTDEGSDPVVLEALNLKTEQSEGIRNLIADGAQLRGADPGHMRKLAEAHLRRIGKLS